MIDFDQIAFGYGTSPLLRISSLTIEAGRSMAIIGPSGSGKTTLLSLIAGILVPQSGALNISGINICALSDAERRRFRSRSIGFVFQDFCLIPYLTVLDNILHPYRIGDQKLSDAARRSAQALAGSLGLGDKLGRYPEALSQGERQRVAIARALVTEPSLILADEPTGNLDVHTKQVCLDLLLENARARQATLLMVTHDTGLLGQFDQVMDISDYGG